MCFSAPFIRGTVNVFVHFDFFYTQLIHIQWKQIHASHWQLSLANSLQGHKTDGDKIKHHWQTVTYNFLQNVIIAQNQQAVLDKLQITYKNGS